MGKNKSNKQREGRGNTTRGNYKAGGPKAGKKNTANGGTETQDYGRSSRNDRYDCVPGHNDPSWYNRFSALVRDSCSLPFSNPLGQTIQSTDISDNEVWYTGDPAIAVPGMMIFDTIPIPGISRDGSSPINIAARAIYNFVRHANSGSSTYDSSDLMQYIYAADSCYAYWAHLVRAYGVLSTYSYSNRYLGEALFRSLGFDWNDFQDSMAQFRATINQFAVRLASLCVPSDMTIVKRHLWMYGNVFTDGDEVKSQLYAYVPEYVWSYAEVQDERGGLLVKVPVRPRANELQWPLTTLADVVSTINRLIIPLVTSESLMNMAGDIRKAYGDASLMKVASIPEQVQLQLTKDERALMEINNITITPVNTEENFEILADANTNTIIFNPALLNFETGEASYNDTVYFRMRTNKFLNIPWANPTGDDVMKATRLMTFCSIDGHYVRQAGTELVTGYRMFYYRKDYPNTSQSPVLDYFYCGFSNDLATGAQNLYYSLANLTMTSNFDFHPILYWTNESTVGNDNTTGLWYAGDLSNYTLLNCTTLDRIHEAALFSELWSPAMGTFMTD